MKANRSSEGTLSSWEASCMIVPDRIGEEEREAFLGRSRKETDKQERESIGKLLSDAMADRIPVKLRMYHPYEELYIIGLIDRMDEARFMVDGEWFPMRDIESVCAPWTQTGASGLEV